MSNKADELYASLRAELAMHDQGAGTPASGLETCFQLSHGYLAQLMETCFRPGFASFRDEEVFFKLQKPRFAAEAEYYGYRYHAALFFQDTEAILLRHSFRTRELRRLDRFIREHRDFYHYMKNGDQYMDDQWFRQTGPVAGQSSCDALVTTLLALEKYTEFLKGLHGGALYR